MTSPVQGGGPIDPSAKLDQLPSPQQFSTNEASSSDEVKVNTKLHPLAEWFMSNWGWSQEQSLSAEKHFLNTVMHQCQQLLNKYKNIYKKLNPDYIES